MIKFFKILGVLKKDMKRTTRTFADVEINDTTLAYACGDADCTLRIFNYCLEKGFEKDFCYEMDMTFTQWAPLLEKTGIKIDLFLVEQLLRESITNSELLEKSCKEAVGYDINLRSPGQIRKYLYEVLNLKPPKLTKKGAPSTDSSSILKLEEKYGRKHSFIAWLKLLRLEQQAQKTFLKPILKVTDPTTNRMYGAIHSCRQSTGRLSISGKNKWGDRINLQNLPKPGRDKHERIRNAFIPDKGHTFVSVDLRNIEIRIIANLCKDPNLCTELLREGGDLHTLTCERIFDIGPSHSEFGKYRQLAKTINFQFAFALNGYGLKHKMVELDYKSVTFDECQELYLEFFNKVYPKWGELKKKQIQEGRKNMYCETAFGRKRSLKRYYSSSDKKQREHGDRVALNHPIQGTNAELIKLMVPRIGEWIVGNSLQDDVKFPSLLVHDEANFSIDGSEADERFILHCRKINEIMCWTPSSWIVPVRVTFNTGPNWGEAKKELNLW